MAEKQNKKEVSYFNLGEDWKVEHVRKLKFGTFFTLRLPGLSLYNLRLVPAGDDYDEFIGMPEDKGSDGDYYKRFALYLTDEDAEEVIDAVKEEAKAAKKSKKKSKKKRSRADEEDEDEEDE